MRLLFFFFFTGTLVISAQFNTPSRRVAKFNKPIKNNGRKLDYIKVSSDTIFENIEKTYKLAVHPPLDSIYITSRFGFRLHPIDGVYKKHRGIDLRAKAEYIYSVSKGIITKVDYDKGLGMYCVVTVGDYHFYYGHLSQLYKKEGTIVEPGTILGVTGSTGKSTAEHLHFAIKYKKVFIDPYLYLDFIKKLSRKHKSEI